MVDTATVLGIYKGGYFNFTFAINSAFPHEPPKVSPTWTLLELECTGPLNSRTGEMYSKDLSSEHRP